MDFQQPEEFRMLQELVARFIKEHLLPLEPGVLARETGIAYGGVLYVDSLTPADGPVPTYLDLLRVTVGRITEELAR